MSQRVFLERGGQPLLLTRQTAYIIIVIPTVKVSSLEPPHLRAREFSGKEVDGSEEKVSLKKARPEWQLVVGKRACKGSGAVLAFDEDRFPIRCTNQYVALVLELELLDPHEEEYFSAALEEGFASAENCVEAN
eukprot:6466331-Amphidinium_carterae.1